MVMDPLAPTEPSHRSLVRFGRLSCSACKPAAWYVDRADGDEAPMYCVYMWVIYRPQQQQAGGRAAGVQLHARGLAGLGWAGWLAGDSFGDGPDG